MASFGQGSGQQTSASEFKSESDSEATQTARSRALGGSESAGNQISGGASASGVGANERAATYGFAAPTIQRQVRAAEGAVPNLSNTGLLPEQERFALRAVQDVGSKLSGNAAARGQLSPMNTEGIVGSALTAAAPAMFSQIGQNVFSQAGMRTALPGQTSAALSPYVQGGESSQFGSGTQQSRSFNEAESEALSQAISRARSLGTSRGSAEQSQFGFGLFA